MPLPSPIPDFDMLLKLYRDDQQAFETLRLHLLQEAIESAPPDKRNNLKKLLGHINSARSGLTPQQAASQAFEMMGDSLQELRISWQQACFALSELQTHLLLERVR